MILPDRQRRILAEIELRLRHEFPDLAARFALFERLAKGEGPPPSEPPLDRSR
jgi:hypothetical protein